jgi:MFS family permease
MIHSAGPARMMAPLRHRPFRRQFLAQTISMTGSALSPVAVAFGVLAANGSASALGLVLAAHSVPNLVLMAAGGVWADRLPRHQLMVATNLVRFVTQTTFGVLLIVGHHPLWALMVLQAIGGAAQAFSAPARLGLTAATAPAGSVQQANALIAVARDTADIAGPVLGGVLTVTIGGGWALVIDGISFVGSAYLLSGLRLPAVARKPRRFFTELRDGWYEVSRRSWVWATIGYFSVFNLLFSIFLVLGPARLAETSKGPVGWGAIMAGLSVGTLSGNALALRFAPRHLLRWPRLMGLLVLPTIVALALGAPVGWLVGSAFFMGLAMSYPDVLWFTALQQEIPEDAISRVSSFDYLGSFVLRPLGYSLAAAMVALGARSSLLVFAAVFLATTLASMLVPGVRNLRRGEPSEPTGESSDKAHDQAGR